MRSASGSNGPLASFVNCVQWLEETIIAYLLGGMAGLAFANIIVRRLFDGSIIWALELTLYLFLYLVLFGMSYVLRKGGHIGVDVMVKLMPATAQKWTEVSAGAISCCYAMFFSYTGWTVTSKFLSTEFLRTVGSDELEIPHWLTYGILALGFAYLGIVIFLGTLDIARGRRTTITASHEAEDMVEKLQAEDD